MSCFGVLAWSPLIWLLGSSQEYRSGFRVWVKALRFKVKGLQVRGFPKCQVGFSLCLVIGRALVFQGFMFGQKPEAVPLFGRLRGYLGSPPASSDQHRYLQGNFPMYGDPSIDAQML